MISWRARTHQQCDSAPLLTYRTKQGKSGTRRSPALDLARGMRQKSACDFVGGTAERGSEFRVPFTVLRVSAPVRAEGTTAVGTRGRDFELLGRRTAGNAERTFRAGRKSNRKDQMASHPKGNARRPGPRRYMLPGADPRTQAYRDEVCQRHPSAASVVSAAPAAIHRAGPSGRCRRDGASGNSGAASQAQKDPGNQALRCDRAGHAQARPFLDLQMGEGDRLAVHQVLACHLEQWHRCPPITAAADSRSARVGQGQAARPHGLKRWRTRH